MAQAVLNPGIELLQEGTPRYDLYSRLYRGMKEAARVDAPVYSDIQPFVLDGEGNPIPDGDGFLIDPDKIALINNGIADYSDIMTRNAAYMFADAFVSVIGAGGGGGGGVVSGDYLPLAGGQLSGPLYARYGFQAGVDGQTAIEIGVRGDEQMTPVIFIRGDLRVDGTGRMDSLGGYYINGLKVMDYSAGVLTLSTGNKIVLDGDTEVNGDFSFNGDITIEGVNINEDGIFKDGLEYYYAGNSNKSDVDWTANVLTAERIVDHGKLEVDGLTELRGGYTFSAGGFNLSGTVVELDSDDNPVKARTVYYRDLELLRGAGLMYDGEYVIWPRSETILSIGAPGKTLNLGDGYDGRRTNKITLQADLYDYSGNFKVISKEGAGMFPNGLTAMSATAGSVILQTYYRDAVDQGVVFSHYLRLLSMTGPGLHAADETTLSLDLPFSPPGTTKSVKMVSSVSMGPTVSRWQNLSIPNSATLFYDTDAEFIAYLKPLEAAEFHIVSDRYKTALRENHLLFSDEAFIEGVVDGMRYVGNNYYLGDLSSEYFTSGFAGTGWAIMADKSYGGWKMTTDYLTVRKKMRVYELEVQKISVTNGSLWVSDSCSGDEVEEVLETA